MMHVRDSIKNGMNAAITLSAVAQDDQRYGDDDDRCVFDDNDDDYTSTFSEDARTSHKTMRTTVTDAVNNNVLGDNFAETVSGSLEDLVNTFDEKITRCFHNYQESVENLAPVQVRSQEEIMNECQ